MMGSLPLKLFTAAAAVEVAAATTGVPELHWIARPLLAPLLIWHIRQTRRKPDAVVYGLGLATLGDLALLIPDRGGLLTAMLFFFGTLVSLTLAFLNRAKPLPGPSAIFALLAVSANALFGDELGALHVPVLLYSLALAAMAAAAAGVSPMIAAGGALFLASDVLVFVNATGVHLPVIAAATHAAALALIAIGWTRLDNADEPVGAGRGRVGRPLPAVQPAGVTVPR
ncbi:lysoplasmalogenase family protein [Actinoplanes sp. OR16]|uniref:lysoplasmalogenase family protein n=1 Tax=Actinoplanes sp. OR16 TaxID=946334 RepID=UPI001E456665|nr:lysoplasmalogenase family protein [Actinoplanes sp. OR16]